MSVSTFGFLLPCRNLIDQIPSSCCTGPSSSSYPSFHPHAFHAGFTALLLFHHLLHHVLDEPFFSSPDCCAKVTPDSVKKTADTVKIFFIMRSPFKVLCLSGILKFPSFFETRTILCISATEPRCRSVGQDLRRSREKMNT